MNQAERTKELLRRAFQQPAEQAGIAAMDERILSDASTSMTEAVAARQRLHRISLWRKIMRTKTARLTTAAAVLAAAFVIMTWGGSDSTAWSIEQTIEAIKQIKSLHIKGVMNYWSEPLDFDCWIRCPDGESELGAMRLECERLTMVAQVQDRMVYFYWPDEKVILMPKQGQEIKDLKFWYYAAQLSPWLTGKIVETLRLFTDDWKQAVVTDPASGKEQVHVTCSYRQSNTSISFVVDTQTKLIERGKMWMNLQQKGEPQFDGQTLIYNEDLPDDFFEFQIPPGARVVTEEDIEQCRILFKQAEDLILNEENYAEVMKVCRQVHDMAPHSKMAIDAMMIVGFCHNRLGDHDKEIETYLAAVEEYPVGRNLGWIYLFLGRAYMNQGQNDKALEAFENCLATNEGLSDPDTFPFEDARLYIAKIKGQ